VEPSHKRTARDRNIFRVIQVLGVWIHGTPGPWECKGVMLKKSFRYAQVSFKTGFTVLYFTEAKRYHSSKFVTLFIRNKNTPKFSRILH